MSQGPTELASHASGEEPVEIVGYDPSWPAAFEREKARLEKAMSGLAVEVMHIGSTSVPGLASKPIIDIMVAVKDMTARSAYESALAPLGYENVPHEDDEKRLFFRKGAPRSHHVHIVRHMSWTYWQHVLFRDFLVAHPEARDEYARMKIEMARAHKTDRKGYTDAKSEFIQRTLQAAVRKE